MIAIVGLVMLGGAVLGGATGLALAATVFTVTEWTGWWAPSVGGLLVGGLSLAGAVSSGVIAEEVVLRCRR